MTRTVHRPVTLPSVCCPTASARRTAPPSPVTCPTRTCPRWSLSPLMTPSTTTTSNSTKRCSTARGRTPTGVTSRLLSLWVINTPTTRPCKKFTGRDTRSRYILLREYSNSAKGCVSMWGISLSVHHKSSKELFKIVDIAVGEINTSFTTSYSNLFENTAA